ncbi:MAG: sigma-70 family polymerase sigma factor [Acidimicrobiales bacterium]|nr:sigma-70 family polymerase sigma factor [Acidimicrobiales bacterium]
MLCERLHPRLVGTLTLHCGDPDVASEIAQEALARAWERWDRVRASESPEAWVFRVAFNLTASRFRRRRRERAAMDRITSRRPPAHRTDAIDALAVRTAVRALPPRQRAALVLRYFADLTVDDTAMAMRCAPGTVKSLTSKAIGALRDELAVDLEEVVGHA